MPEREQDECGRALYADDEIPPADARFAIWRGGVTSPDTCLEPYEGPGDPGIEALFGSRDWHGTNQCIGGWIRSLDWWFHCGICRPGKWEEHQELCRVESEKMRKRWG